MNVDNPVIQNRAGQGNKTPMKGGLMRRKTAWSSLMIMKLMSELQKTLIKTLVSTHYLPNIKSVMAYHFIVTASMRLSTLVIVPLKSMITMQDVS